jgi:hypothetical protein
MTPFGEAITKEDAKEVKSGWVEKQKFDKFIDQMIGLREKNKGGAILNREDVARGKQLSKDALLAYKNMAKLGVLSASDEEIINAIIPKDPLSFNDPLSEFQGKDPILNNLKMFKKDSDENFQNTLKTRLMDSSSLEKDESLPQEKLGKDGKTYIKKEDGKWYQKK